VRNHVSIEVTLAAQGQPAQGARERPVAMNLLHVRLEDLHVFQSFPTYLTLDLLALPGQDDVVRLAEMSPVSLLPGDHELAVRTAHTKLFPPGGFYRNSRSKTLDRDLPCRLLPVVSLKLGLNLDRGRLGRDHLALHHLGRVNVVEVVVVIHCVQFPLPVLGLHLDVGQRGEAAQEVDQGLGVVFTVQSSDGDVEFLIGDLGQDEAVRVAEVHHPEAGGLEDGHHHGLVEVGHAVHALQHQVSVLLLAPKLPQHVAQGRQILLPLPYDVLGVGFCHLFCHFWLLLGSGDTGVLHWCDGGRGVTRGQLLGLDVELLGHRLLQV